MSVHTFFLAPEAWGPTPELSGQEARHANVLRLKAGNKINLINGEGLIAECRISAIDKHRAKLEVLNVSNTSRPSSLAIIALALSKATRRGFFLEKAAELGASEIWLWQADHSQGKLSSELAENCQGQILAGCKQCLNPWLPKIWVMEKIDEVIKESARADWRILPWEAQQGIPMLAPDKIGRPGTTVYVIGPEGGFSTRELDLLGEAKFMPVSLGHRILRCETAATLCLGLHWWASQLPGHPDFKQE